MYEQVELINESDMDRVAKVICLVSHMPEKAKSQGRLAINCPYNVVTYRVSCQRILALPCLASPYLACLYTFLIASICLSRSCSLLLLFFARVQGFQCCFAFIHSSTSPRLLLPRPALVSLQGLKHHSAHLLAARKEDSSLQELGSVPV